MKSSIQLFTGFALAILLFLACKKNKENNSAYIKEANELLATAAQQRGVSKEDFMKTLVDKGKFTSKQNVFLPSALAVDFTKKWVTLPVYTGIGPSGNPTYFIITEGADYEVAKLMGLNYAPKLVNGRGPLAASR